MMVDNIHPLLCAQPFFILLDPGSSHTLLLINRRAIPTGLTIQVNGTTKSTTAQARRHIIKQNERVQLQGIHFPELATTRRISETITAIVKRHGFPNNSLRHHCWM